MTPGELLRSIPIGTRVVVRYLLETGRATDALGYLRSRDAEHVVVETKRGLETVRAGDGDRRQGSAPAARAACAPTGPVSRPPTTGGGGPRGCSGPAAGLR